MNFNTQKKVNELFNLIDNFIQFKLNNQNILTAEGFDKYQKEEFKLKSEIENSIEDCVKDSIDDKLKNKILSFSKNNKNNIYNSSSLNILINRINYLNDLIDCYGESKDVSFIRNGIIETINENNILHFFEISKETNKIKII